MSRRKRKRREFKKSKLETSVFKVPGKFIKRDDGGRYIPYCLMSFHAGVIKTPWICEERECKFYNKLYFPNKYGGENGKL